MAIGEKIFVADRQQVENLSDKIDSILNGQNLFIGGMVYPHLSVTILDISGSGVLTALFGVGNSGVANVRVQTDNGDVVAFNLNAGQHIPLQLTFENKLKITTASSINSLNASYKLF